MSMDHLTPPTSALQNLTITDSLSPPTTALKPRDPCQTLSQQESCRQVHLNNLLRQLYGPSKTSCSSMLPKPQPCDDFSIERRTKIVRLQGLERVRGSFNCLRKKLRRLLRDMAKSKPEHRDKLLLANLYIQQRKHKEEVLSIIKSLY